MTRLDLQDPGDARLVAWIERELDGTVVSLDRQTRWRPAWFVEVDRGGTTQSLYVRGRRGGGFTELVPFHQEAAVQQVLHEHGIPVAKVHGVVDDPEAIVMDRLPGQDDVELASDHDREQVFDQYIDALARMHEIPLAAFAAIGLRIPEGPEETALGLYAPCEAIYRAAKSQPDPMVEFVLRWLHRNVPMHRTRRAFVTGDSGQFMFDGPQLTGLIDFEMVHVGDPLAEFGGLRVRNRSEKSDDVVDLARRYEARTGDVIDKASVEYHTAGYTLMTPLLYWRTVHHPVKEDDYVAFFSWYVVLARWACEAIAEVIGAPLDPIEPPAGATTPAGVAFHHQVASLDEWPDGDEFTNYRRSCAQSLAVYLQHRDEFGAGIEAQDLEETAALIGHRPDPSTATGELEQFVLSAGPEHDVALVQYFHRWQQRREFLLRATGPSAFLVDSHIVPVPGLRGS
jgi:aminoglycoside phosphotransferase (APT) family kinase protein